MKLGDDPSADRLLPDPWNFPGAPVPVTFQGPITDQLRAIQSRFALLTTVDAAWKLADAFVKALQVPAAREYLERAMRSSPDSAAEIYRASFSAPDYRAKTPAPTVPKPPAVPKVEVVSERKIKHVSERKIGRPASGLAKSERQRQHRERVKAKQEARVREITYRTSTTRTPSGEEER